MKIFFENSRQIGKKDTVLVFTYEGFDFKTLPTRMEFMRLYGTALYFSELKSTLYLPSDKEADLIVVPLKNGDAIETETIRSAAAQAVRIAMQHKKSTMKIVLPEIKNISREGLAVSITEGVILGGYIFNRYKSDDDETANSLESCTFLGETEEYRVKVLNTALVCNNSNLCRDMVNSGTEEINPDSIEKAATAIAKTKNMSMRVLNEKKLISKKMNLICAVGRAGRYRPRVLELKYKGGKSSDQWTAFVGKGVTFDTGGLDVKTAAGMLDMRYDMAGAASVLYAIKSIAELKLPVNVYAVIPLVENAVDSQSYKPGDVFVSYSGKSVHVQNTDAEGRLILADVVAYAEKDLKADSIIDIATLTGACSVALGSEYAALVTYDDSLRDTLIASSLRTGEKLWQLPINKAYEKMIKSDIADIANISADRKAGTIVGAAFVKQFIDKSRWAHIDIAGTAWADNAGSIYGKYSTGYGVRLLTDFASGSLL